MKRAVLALGLALTTSLAAQPVYIKGNPNPVPAEAAPTAPSLLALDDVLLLEPVEFSPPRYFGHRTGKSRWEFGAPMNRDAPEVSPPVWTKPGNDPTAGTRPVPVVTISNAVPAVAELAPLPETPAPPPAVTMGATGPRPHTADEAAPSDEATLLRGNAARDSYWSQRRAHRPTSPLNLPLRLAPGTEK